MVRQQLVHWRFVGAIASTAGQLVARKTPRARRSVSGEPQCGPQLEVEAALKPPELEDLAGEPTEVPRGDLLAALLGDHVHRLAGELLPAVYGPVVLCEPLNSASRGSATARAPGRRSRCCRSHPQPRSDMPHRSGTLGLPESARKVMRCTETPSVATASGCCGTQFCRAMAIRRRIPKRQSKGDRRGLTTPSSKRRQEVASVALPDMDARVAKALTDPACKEASLMVLNTASWASRPRTTSAGIAAVMSSGGATDVTRLRCTP